jgi:hypothetical protein
MDERIGGWIALYSRDTSIYSPQKLLTEALCLRFISLVRISDVSFRFGSE